MGLPSSASVWVAEIGERLLEAFERLGFRHELVARDKRAGRHEALDGGPVLRRRLVAQVHRQLRRAAPVAAQALEVRRRQEKDAEHEQGDRDRRRREQAGLPSTPETGDRFVERIPERVHQAISTIRPWSSVMARRPTRRISSRSWVATTTVVPRAFDLAKQVHDLERQVGIEIAGRLVGEDELRIVDERARDGDPLLLASRQFLGQGVHAVLQTDPLEHLKRLSMLHRLRHAEHAHDERDVLKDGESRDQSKILKDETDRSAVALDLRGGQLAEVAPAHAQPPLARQIFTQQQPEKRRLARSARTSQKKKLAFVDGE